MNIDYKWQVPLSKRQKLDLDKSIIEYIDWHFNNNNSNSNSDSSGNTDSNILSRDDLIQNLNKLFQIPNRENKKDKENGHPDDIVVTSHPKQLLLPRKWDSIVQLQRKIMTLEQTIKQLNIQLDTLKDQVIDTSDDNNNNNIFAANNNNSMSLWTPKSSVFNSLTVESSITAIKLHPFLPIVIIGTNHGKLYLFDILNTSLPLLSINAHTNSITSIDAMINNGIVSDQLYPTDSINNGNTTVTSNKNSIIIITSSKDMSIRVWEWSSINPTSYQLFKTLMGHDHIISQIKLFSLHENTRSNNNDNSTNNNGSSSSSNGNNNSPLLVSCSRDNTIKIWNIQNGWCIKSINNAHSDWIRSVDVFGEYILSAGHDTSVRLTHWPTGNGLSMGIGHNFPIEKVKFIPINKSNINCSFSPSIMPNYRENIYNNKMGFKYCLTAGRDNLIKMWEIPTPKFTTNGTPIPNINQDDNKFTVVKEFTGHTSWVRDLKVSYSNPVFFSCGDDRSLRMWNYESGEAIKVWENYHSSFINCIDMDSFMNPQDSRKLLVSGSIDCKCNILMN